MEIELPEHTLEWLREFGREASPAAWDADRVTELVRMTERQQRVVAGTWNENLEAEFLAFQKALS